MATVNLKQRIVGAIVIVALAVIFLPMLLQQTKGPKLNIKEIPAPPQKPQVQALKEIAPVQLTAPGPQTNSAPAWSLQLGTFANEKNATVLVQHLRKKGFVAYSVDVSTATGKVVKVYVGPELKLKKLQAQAQALEKELKLKGKIIPFKAISQSMQEKTS